MRPGLGGAAQEPSPGDQKRAEINSQRGGQSNATLMAMGCEQVP